jgi:hypothetical protein
MCVCTCWRYCHETPYRSRLFQPSYCFLTRQISSKLSAWSSGRIEHWSGIKQQEASPAVSAGEASSLSGQGLDGDRSAKPDEGTDPAGIETVVEADHENAANRQRNNIAHRKVEEGEQPR